MAIAISSVTSGTDTGVSATVSVTTSESPTTTKIGDLVVVVNANDFYALSNMGTPTATGTPTMNAITGATGDGGTNEAHIKAWWYVANTAGAQTISATESGAHDEEKSITAYVLTGADTSTPVDAATSNTSTTTIATSQVAPAVSPATSNAFLICQITSGGGAATASYTTPAPLTEQFEIHAGSISGVGATNQLSASGSTGTFTFTAATSTAYSSCSIAIKTASAAAATATPGPLVVTAGRPSPTAPPTIIRSTLADPPVLTTRSPIVASTPVRISPPFLPTLSRSSLVDVVAPSAATPSPIVVTQPVRQAPSAPIVARATLADPPVLTTSAPIVVTPPARQPAAVPALFVRSSLIDLATPGPLVVTGPWAPPRLAPVLLSRSSLADVVVPVGTATPQPIVVTNAARPPWPYRPLLLASPRSQVCDCVTHRSTGATTTRPTTGTTARPATGVTARPCNC